MKEVIKLVRGSGGMKPWVISNGVPALCHEELNTLYDIPDSATELYVTISDKESENSYYVSITNPIPGEYIEVKLSNGRYKVFCVHRFALEAIKRRKVSHVSIEYI